LALILNIETATSACSVALAREGEIIALQENNEGQSHARVLTTLIANCFSQTEFSLSDLNAVAVSKGPGSYTGLRIGVSTAKGLCYALAIPLISVNTLQSMASVVKTTEKIPETSLLCPMIDARRMEVYTAFFEQDFSFYRETAAVIIEPESFVDILQNRQVVFFGDGMKKLKQLINHQTKALFVELFEPSASGMVLFSEKSYNSNIFESTAYFEPFYLKDFYSTRQPL
jgi:tRNA threonylcarbamoyladenosine biosynthesis protein TsaB